MKMFTLKVKYSTYQTILTQLIVEQTMIIIKNWIAQENPTPSTEFKDDFLKLVKSPFYYTPILL